MKSITVRATIERVLQVGDKVRIVGQRFAFDTFFKAGEIKDAGHDDRGVFVKIEFLGGVVILHGELNIVQSIAPAVAAPIDPAQAPPPVPTAPEPIPGGFSMATIGLEEEPPPIGLPPGLTRAQMMKSRSAGMSEMSDSAERMVNEAARGLGLTSPPAAQNTDVPEELPEQKQARLPGEAPDIEPL